jgi:hypothetical protein
MILMGAGVTAADPHEHGVAHLDVAIDGAVVSLTLRGAGDGFVGFEYTAGTDEEHRRVEAASAALRQGEKLFAFDAVAGCTQTSADIDVPHESTVNHADHDKHGHPYYHQYGEEHEDHADWSAQWEFECREPGAIRVLRTDLFDAFPRISEVRVQFISKAMQTGAKLTASSRRLTVVPTS